MLCRAIALLTADLNNFREDTIQAAVDVDPFDLVGDAFQHLEFLQSQGNGVVFHYLGGIEHAASGRRFLATSDDVGLG